MDLQYSKYFNFFLERLYLFYIFICAFLPTGTLFNINIKILLFSMILLMFIPILLSSKIHKSIYLVNITILFILFFYFLLGLINGYFYLSVLTEFKFIFILYIMLLINYFIYMNSNNKLEYVKRILIYAIYGSILFLLFKTYYFIALLLGMYDYAYMKDTIYPTINYVPVGLGIETGGSRFSFITLDFLSVVLYTAYLFFKKNYLYIKLPFTIEFIYTISLCISLFSAYSRFLFVLFPLLLLFVLVLNKEYKKIFFLSFIAFIISSYFYNEIQLIIAQRFLNQEASDHWRLLMSNGLINSWAESPILGRGIGSYSFEIIRDRKMLFSYEVQFLSLFMQFGVTFFIFIAILLFILLQNLFYNRAILYIFIISILLMLASMTNQYLLSTTTGVLYILIMNIIIFFNKRRRMFVKM